MNQQAEESEVKKLCPQVATLYRTVVSFGTTETQLIWARYAGFLVLNGFFVDALLAKLEPPQKLLLVVIGTTALLANAFWHILNFVGWLNQNRWYHIAANLDKSLDGWKLPTDKFKERVNSPHGWIYWLAQMVPTCISIGAPLCMARGLSGSCLTCCQAICISGAIWIVVAIVVVVIEYKAIAAPQTRTN